MVSLSINPPPSSRQPRSSRGGLVAILFGTVVLLALAGGFWLGRATAPGGSLSDTPRRRTAAAPAPGPAPPLAAERARRPAPPAPRRGAAPGRGAERPRPRRRRSRRPPPRRPADPAAPTVEARERRAPGRARGVNLARAAARGSRIADQLTQVVNRLLVWDLQVARDGRKGDRLDVVYTPSAPVAPGLPPSAEPVVEAVRYVSQKLGKAFSVYRFQPEGARWPRYYREDGTELEERLVDAPIGDYEQVTSLLRDGRRHKGVDFKRAGRHAGVRAVRRRDRAAELELRAGTATASTSSTPRSGRHAIFLHLEVAPEGDGRRAAA